MNKKILLATMIIAITALAPSIATKAYETYKNGDSSIIFDSKELNVNRMEKDTRMSQKYIDVRINSFVLWENQGPAKLLLFSHDYGAGKNIKNLKVGDVVKLTTPERGEVEYVVKITQEDNAHYIDENNVFMKESSSHDLVMHTCSKEKDMNHYVFLTEVNK